MKAKINANGTEITVISKGDDNDYISLTDIARYKNPDEPKDVVKNWMRNRSTIEFLGLWEQLNNPDFKGVEFDSFKHEAGSNAFTLSPQKWISSTNAVGLISKSGRYGGTFAHKDIAFEFASWVSAEFKLYIIKDYQRLKSDENSRISLEWNVNRIISKINYRIHTDAIRDNIIPSLVTKGQQAFTYASEADLLNVALFGKTAREWKEQNPEAKGNIRDDATIQQLIVLSNLESMNAELIKQDLPQNQRLTILNKMAIEQLTSLVEALVSKNYSKQEKIMNKIDQKDINNAAWAACDTFRGVVDPAQYKDYILVMLFLKYISDVWQDHYEEYQKQYGDDHVRIVRKLERERFVLPVVKLIEKNDETGEETVLEEFPATYYSLYERRSAANIGELINIVLDHIEESNKSKLEGVFRNIDFNSEANLGKTKDRNRRLKQLLEDFHKPQLNMKPSLVSEDVIGNTYIYLIERFASDSGKKAGEFFTPLKVTELVAKLAGPKPGDRICDPACGSGGLLIQAGKHVGDRNFALFGQESNGSTWALCRMNMFLHSFDSARVEWCDTLNSPLLVENDRLMKFNCVVANPPFSLDKWGAENAESDQYNRFWRGVPPKSKGDWAFISHMVETALEKQGRVAVVVPHGVLFRGAAEGRIRQKMIEENLLDAVIGLPGNLFPTTNIPVAILVFDRSREKGGAREECKNVFFVDASREFVSGKNQNTLSETHIDKIMATYTTRAEEEKYAHVAEFAEIKENDFNLNIPRYVDTFEEEEEIDIDAVQVEIDDLEKELAEVRVKMAEKLKDIQR